jgi:uncharacterized protein (TIGR02118 family)
MHKLVILFDAPEDWQAFDDAWPQFLHHVEEMPGLRREAFCRVESFLFGACRIVQMHELFFDTLEEAQQAMASPQGQAAGRLLQTMTAGRMTFFIADHKEDDLSRIRQYKVKSAGESPSPQDPITQGQQTE